MEDALLCNFKKCRKRLRTFAWVTSCSHVFCDEDGEREFNKSSVCPACESELPGKFDIVRVDLQPSEEYKSMILTGQRPETVMEICSRALSFWTYQAHQEKTFQEYCATKSKEKLQQVETYYEQLFSRTQAELSAVKTQIDSTKKELQVTRMRFNEASEKLMEKNRQYQKLQVMYDSLRRRSVTMASFEGEDRPSDTTSPLRCFKHHQFELPLGTTTDGREAILPLPIGSGSKMYSPKPPNLPTNSIAMAANMQLQVDSLAAAVSAGALQQKKMETSSTHSGEQFNLDMSCNPASIAQRLVGRRFQ